MQIRVDLLGGRGADLDPTPGRIFICGPGHDFGQLADAINRGFARWDLSHMHEFELADGRKIGYPDDDFGPDLIWEDQSKLKVLREIKPGEEFAFTFDFGDDWHHRCQALPEKIDPRAKWGPGPLPPVPVPVFGWGSIPDQYGRLAAPDLEPDL